MIGESIKQSINWKQLFWFMIKHIIAEIKILEKWNYKILHKHKIVMRILKDILLVMYNLYYKQNYVIHEWNESKFYYSYKGFETWIKQIEIHFYNLNCFAGFQHVLSNDVNCKFHFKTRHF